MTYRALTRAVSSSLADCQLTHVTREVISVERARQQHAAYERTLEQLGCRVQQLAEAPDLPDAVFIEDTAIVLDELAIVTRPGATTRRREVGAVAEALRSFRPLFEIGAPATLDGGDVLRLGQTLYVGRGSRTNAEGVAALARIVEPFGYRVEAVPVAGALHLKTAVTEVADGLLIANSAWVDLSRFPDWDAVLVHPDEPFGGNALRIGDSVIHSTAFPHTAQRLRERGVHVVGVDASELAKAEGGVTCCALVFA